VDEDEGMGVSSAASSANPGDPFDIKTTAVAIIDAEGVIVYWSEGAQNLLGRAARDVLGRPVGSLWAGGDPTAVLSRLRRIDSGWDGVITVRHGAGHTVRLAIRTCPLHAASGSRDWLVTGCDVADRRRHESYEAVARGLLEHSPVGIAMLDTQLRYRWVNRALTGMEECSAASPADDGAAPAPADAGQTSPVVTRHARQVLISGQSQVTLEHAPPRHGNPGRRSRGHSRLRSFFPLRDGSGRTLGICYAALDVTGQDPARERLALLNAASEHIGTTLDLDRTVQELAEVMVPQVSDFVAIDLLDLVQTTKALPTRAAHGETLRRAAHLSIQEDQPEVVVGIGVPTRYPPQSPQTRCLATGKPIREVVRPSTSWLADDPPRWRKMVRLGVHTHMVVPLRARGITMGVVTLLRWKNPDPFDEDDLLLVEELVARAAVCVDNARRFAREHEAALTLQTSLLPPNLPAHSAVEVAHRYLPADAEAGVGGDWYDVIPLSGARVALVWATWSVMASTPRPAWGGCAPPCRRWPIWICSRTSCWRASTTSSCGCRTRRRRPPRARRWSVRPVCTPSTTRSPARSSWPARGTPAPRSPICGSPSSSPTFPPARPWAWAACRSSRPRSRWRRAASSRSTPTG
jgi:PAS domain S-box-containing protein